MPCAHPLQIALASATLAVTAALAAGCDTEGCLRGDDGCTVPSACRALDDDFVCDDDSVELVLVSAQDPAPGGLDAVGAHGDWLFRNSLVEIVVDAIEHPQHIAPTGGAVLDMATRGDNNDAINHIFQAVGALPTDAVQYTRSKTLSGDGYVALQFDGHLVDNPAQRVHTRYELRACEPGLRVRTEMVNGGDDKVVWSNADGYWWGTRSMMPWTPSFGSGYAHPAFGLSTLNEVFATVPFMVGASHGAPASAIATVPCNVNRLEGFHSGQVSALGTARRIVPPRDYQIYERFFAVASGAGAAPGVSAALVVREGLFEEASVKVTGRILVDGDARGLGDATRASLFVLEIDPLTALQTPLTEVVPNESGAFAFRVHAQRSYAVEVYAFGAVVKRAHFHAGEGDIEIDPIEIDAVARIEATVRVDGDLDHAQLIVLPADDETAERNTAQYFASGPPCAPLLGPPFGASPACNRVLTDGVAAFELPAGSWQVWATAGIGASIDRVDVEVLPGDTVSIDLSLFRHALPGLSADFHVHGAKSFDSTIPDRDRVRAFLAAGIDVLAATDHDAVWDYAEAMASLGADRRIKLFTGLESTGQVLWKLNPSVYFPQVIGHWIFWPVPFEDDAPRNGAPWDELVEPGALFDRVAARGFDRRTGVIQLNHPWASLEFARDLGFPRAIGVQLDDDLPRTFDGTGPSLFFRTPDGASFGNAEYDAQEVMNGTSNELLLAYRALWFYLLDQGVVKVGTANSDSHSLTDNILGTPRNVVFTDVRLEAFNGDAFNADVKQGHLIGTNGPIIEAFVVDGARRYRPGTQVQTPVQNDAALIIRVDAPQWVPINEVRIVVNGRAIAISAEAIDHPSDPLAQGMTRRLDTQIPLSSLISASSDDNWIVVEAGDTLVRTGDLDCDGVPDTTDNNGDGDINWQDVDRNGDGVVTRADRDEADGPEDCLDAYGADSNADRPSFGPMLQPAAERGDVDFPFAAVTPGGFPFAFTNPILLDRNGDGFAGPGVSP